MGQSRDKNGVCLRVKVTTRLAFLDITQVDFADAIGMDKSQLSRVLRADSPRSRTLKRIALGLGLKVADLGSASDVGVLVSDHPANDRGLSRADRTAALRAWYEKKSNGRFSVSRTRHQPEETRHARRLEVRQALREDRFNLEFIRDVAGRYGVSASQIYADRTQLRKTEIGDR